MTEAQLRQLGQTVHELSDNMGYTGAEAAFAAREFARVSNEIIENDPLLKAIFNARIEWINAPKHKRLWWRLTGQKKLARSLPLRGSHESHCP